MSSRELFTVEKEGIIVEKLRTVINDEAEFRNFLENLSFPTRSDCMRFYRVS